jgi:hypothetical protein
MKRLPGLQDVSSDQQNGGLKQLMNRFGQPAQTRHSARSQIIANRLQKFR